MIDLFLFDLDGVLVGARGYVKALQDTVAHFSRRMGVGYHPPTEDEVRTFEAWGLGCEWVSGAMCVAALLVARLRQEPLPSLPSVWPDALSTLGAHPCALPCPDYAALAQSVGRRIKREPDAAQAVRAVLWDDAERVSGRAPIKSALAPLLDTLLGHTHDFYRAPVTRYFQHLALGNRGVAKTYGIAPEFESPAYLSRYDRPLLSHSSRARLLEAAASHQIRGALYTARPSLPPVEVNRSDRGYAPEAEMARSLVRLREWPLIGMGRMRWLAQHVDEKVEQLVKPSPVQALAAIGAAWSGKEMPALEAAVALYRDDELHSPLGDLGPITLHVFEDTTGGLRAVKRGAEMLRATGATVECRPYAVGSINGPKATAVARQDVPIYPSVNEAIVAALSSI